MGWEGAAWDLLGIKRSPVGAGHRLGLSSEGSPTYPPATSFGQTRERNVGTNYGSSLSPNFTHKLPALARG